MSAAEKIEQPTIISVSPKALVDFKGGNTRRKRNENDYAELVASVKKNGILQQPVVRPTDKDGEYEIVFGHNRRDAAIDAGLELINVEVRENMGDRDALEAHLEENLVRSDLTFSDQVRAAVRWTSFYQGDRKSAAERLNWTVTRLSEKLELANCVDDVLDALDSGEIKAGHALILATMPEKTQRGSLKTIINEDLTVKALKERAAKIRLPLSSAIFDKSDCADCPHNSERQGGLFDMGEADATCSNRPCYRDKTHSALAEQKTELEEQYGKVIFLSESVQSDRKTVDPANVGKEQFESGCQACADRAALLDDRPTQEGKVYQSQCLNIECFNKCVTAFNESQTKTTTKNNEQRPNPEKTDKANEEKTTTDSESPRQAPKKQATSAKASTPNTVIEKHKAEITAFAKKHLIDDEIFRLAYMVLSVEHFGNGISSTNFQPRMTELMKLDKKALFAELSTVVTKSIEKSTMFSGHTVEFEFMKHALLNKDGGVEAAIADWQPKEENLNPYYTEGLKAVCKDAGIDKHDDYKSWASKTKKVFISGILKAKHDWSNFAPTAFKKLLGK